MHKLTFVLCSAAFACAACNEATDEPSSDPFLGKWSCTETRTLQFTSPAGTADATSVAHSTIVVGLIQGQLTMDSQPDGGMFCPTAFTEKEKGVNGDLPSGQSCQTLDGLSLNYTMGQVTLDMTGMHMTLAFGFAGTQQLGDGGAPVAVEGTGTTDTVCTKIVAAAVGGSSGGGW